MDKKIRQFCQSCEAANSPSDAICHKCGTRLMIVTFPTSQKHVEEIVPPSYYEDHLLERVSIVEFHLKQVTEQLAKAYEFITKQAEEYDKDHLLISSFMEAVDIIEPEQSQRLVSQIALNYGKKLDEKNQEAKKEFVVNEIISNHQSSNSDLFTHLLREGLKYLDENEEKQAFSTLERALNLSPKNLALHLFIAEKLFALDKFNSAKKYLESANKLAPQNLNVMLLLAFIYADKGEVVKSRKLLNVLATASNTIVCANYISGYLAALEGNWTESIIAFEESFELSDLPEFNYLIGSAYYQTNNFTKALEYLESAVLDEQTFADAWFMICEIYKQLDKPTKEEYARQMAFQAKEAGAKSLKFMGKNNSVNLEFAVAFLHLNLKKKCLLTGGSLRMTNFIKKLVLASID